MTPDSSDILQRILSRDSSENIFFINTRQELRHFWRSVAKYDFSLVTPGRAGELNIEPIKFFIDCMAWLPDKNESRGQFQLLIQDKGKEDTKTVVGVKWLLIHQIENQEKALPVGSITKIMIDVSKPSSPIA
jgi:glutaredoxin 2